MTLLADDATTTPAGIDRRVDFDTAPDRYRHWRLAIDSSSKNYLTTLIHLSVAT